MPEKKKIAPKVFIGFLVIVGLVLLANVIGLVIELIVTFGLIQIDQVSIRTFSPISHTLSIFFIAAGITFLQYGFRKNDKLILWWHIFMGTALLSVLYKFVKPTILTQLVPGYYFIAIILTVGIWGGILYYLNNFLTKHRLSH